VFEVMAKQCRLQFAWGITQEPSQNSVKTCLVSHGTSSSEKINK
jgi:hypothetical protein